MPTLTENYINDLKINKPTRTQLKNATTLSTDELYLVDPQFTGSKLLATDSDGDIIETEMTPRKTVEDLTSTTISISDLAGNTDYQFGTITSLTISSSSVGYEETNVFFTSSTTINVSLPQTVKVIGYNNFIPNKSYVISICNDLAVIGES